MDPIPAIVYRLEIEYSQLVKIVRALLFYFEEVWPR
jgi:hypothetical protein